MSRSLSECENHGEYMEFGPDYACPRCVVPTDLTPEEAERQLTACPTCGGSGNVMVPRPEGLPSIASLRGRCQTCSGSKVDPSRVSALALIRAQEREEATEGWRRLLAFHHGCNPAALYGDDGELACGLCRVDFKRIGAAELERRWFHEDLEALRRAQQEAAK
jgi:hypothetical protein